MVGTELKLREEWRALEKREKLVSEWAIYASTLYRALKDDFLFNPADDYIRKKRLVAELPVLEQLLSESYGFDSVIAVLGTISTAINPYGTALSKQPLSTAYHENRMPDDIKRNILAQFDKNNEGGAYRNILALEISRIKRTRPANVSVAVLIPLPALKKYASVQLKKPLLCQKVYTRKFDWLYAKQKVLGECNNTDIRRLKRMLGTFNPYFGQLQQKWLEELASAPSD